MNGAVRPLFLEARAADTDPYAPRGALPVHPSGDVARPLLSRTGCCRVRLDWGKAVDQVADYEIVRSLGVGNHGEFYLVRAPSRLGVTEEFLALKVWACDAGDAASTRATRELRAFAAVGSPYLVTLFDAGQVDNRFFYSMEYLPLGSLANAGRPLDRSEVLRALADAARAAHALHEAGIVHRDIKPSNI